jgi:hypothetical protein
MKVACDTSSSIQLFGSIGKGSTIDTLVQPKPLLLKTQSFRHRNQKETEANREIHAILYRSVLHDEEEEETDFCIQRAKSAQQLRQTNSGYCSPPLRTLNPICYDRQFEDTHERTEDELGLFKFSP